MSSSVIFTIPFQQTGSGNFDERSSKIYSMVRLFFLKKKKTLYNTVSFGNIYFHYSSINSHAVGVLYTYQ